MSPSADARVHPRARAHIRVEYHFANTAGVGSTNDISEGGLFMHCDHSAAPGTRIYLRLYLPGSMAGEPLKIIGMVKRTNPGDEPGMGIHFEIAYSKTREQLGDFMRNMLVHGGSEPPPPPEATVGTKSSSYSHRFPALAGHERARTLSPDEVERAFAFATPIDGAADYGRIGKLALKLLVAVAVLGTVAYLLIDYAAKFAGAR